MAGGSGKGIEWMIKLDAKTQGATDVIQALNKTRSAAEVAGAAIDQALSKMEGHKEFKTRLAMENAGWNQAIQGAKNRISAEEKLGKYIMGRTAMTKLETYQLEKQHVASEAAKESLTAGVFKAQLLMEGLKLGAEFAVGAVKKVGEVMWDAVKAASGAERLDKVFANMLGKDEGRKTLAWLEDFAELTEFTDDQVKPLAASLIRVGLTGPALHNAMSAAVDAASLSTDKVGGLGEAVSSLAKIARTGRVDSRTLAGLALNPHDVAEQLSKDLGMLPDVVKKKLEEGTLRGVDAMGSIFTVIEKQTGKQLGGAGLEMAKGLDARLGKLKEVPDEIFKKLKDTQGFEDISNTIARITELLSPKSPVGEKLFGALSRMVDAVGDKLKGINWEGVANSITHMLDKITALIDPLSEVAKVLGKIVDFGASKLGTLLKVAGAPATALGYITGKVFGDRDALIESMGEQNERAWDEIGRAHGYAAGKGVEAGGRLALESKSPSRVWMRIGADSAEGFALGMEDGAPRVREATATVAAAPSIGDLRGSVGSSSTLNAGGVTVEVNVNVGGSSASPEEIGREVASQVPTAILAALEQFNACAGLA